MDLTAALEEVQEACGLTSSEDYTKILSDHPEEIALRLERYLAKGWSADA